MKAFLTYAFRSWKNAKSVALLAAIALAIGIGSATAVYTVVEAVLLRPVPWHHGERFVTLFSSRLNDASKYQWSSTSLPDLQDFERRTHSFDAFGVFLPREFSLTSPGQPQHLTGVEVSPSLVQNLGVSPVIGRWFGESSAEQGNAYLATISRALWTRLGSDPTIVGRTLTMDGSQYTVTGVMPEWFRLPVSSVGGGELRSDVWVPLNPQASQKSRDFAGYFAYARLKPGVSTKQADEDVKRVASEIAREFPKQHAQYTALVLNLLESVVKETRPTLLLLFGAAGVLLLLTCANVAGLLLARSITRARETALRVALGASQWRLATQYFAEGVLVAMAGAAGGIVISIALTRLVLSLAADTIPRADDIGINWTVLLFAFAVSVLCTVLCSLAPLWQAVRILPNEALSDGVRASAPARSRRLSRTLVIAEIALAFTLLSVSSVLIAHLNQLLRVAPGFEPNGVATFTVNANRADYPQFDQLSAYQTRLLNSIEQIPGVSSAALVDHLPLNGCCMTTSLFPDGISNVDKGYREVNIIGISSQYFQTMQIPVLQARAFNAADDGKGDLLNIVIDSAAAKEYWGGRDALGAYAHLGGPNGSRVRVVGIVGNVRNRGLGDATEAEVYVPSTAMPINPMQFVVRSAVPLSALIPAARRVVQGVDRAQSIYDARPLKQIVLGSLTAERLQSLLTAFFASAAMLLAALGVYGVVSYSVRQRTVEIGTRMALGAVGRDILALVLGDGFKMAVYGVAAGCVVVVGAVFVLKASIFGIRIDDPLPFLYSTGIVASFAAIACFFPGWRATLVTPMVAIRDDPGSLWRSAVDFVERVSHLMPGPARELSDNNLLAEFVQSSRQAESLRQAIQLSLDALREAIKSRSALLLEKRGAEYRCTIQSPRQLPLTCSLPVDGLLLGRLRGYLYPLPLTPGDLDAWRRWASAKQEHLAEIESLEKAGVALAVPLLDKNEIAGILLLGPPEDRAQFSDGEKRALHNCAGQFALMLENARLTDRMLEQEKINRDVQLAVEVQKRLFPDQPPAIPGLSLAGVSVPARSVGGDYYDFFDLGGQRIGIALADVAGKGVAAALIMSVVQASLRILAIEQNASLADLAARMNRLLHRSTGSSSYATFFYAQIDGQTRQLRYVNAGHNPPCLLRCAADQSIEELPAGGTVIGLFPKSSYEEAAVELQPGDVLLAFTDGVPEAQNPAEEEFGEERLKDLLRRTSHLPVNEMASSIAGELKRWIGDAPQFDDLTFVLVKVAP